MPRRKYTPEIKKFIVDNVKGTKTRELVEIVNEKFGLDFTINKMRSYMKNHNLKTGTSKGLPAGRPTDLYPKEVRDYIKENHNGTGPKEMAYLLNEIFDKSYTQRQLNTFYKNNKINSGLTGQFVKGQEPIFIPLKGTRSSPATEFKKGDRPPNWKPLGSERICSKDGYVLVKVADGQLQKNWKAKHKVIWEQHNGPIPKGHAVIFMDRDMRNLNIDNLALVSRSELLMLNRQKMIYAHPELTKSGIMIAKLQDKIYKVGVKK